MSSREAQVDWGRKQNDSQPEWLSRNELAGAGLVCAHGSLVKWCNKGCPLLGGRKLRSMRNPRRKNAGLYWRDDVIELVAAQSQPQLPDEFEEAGAKWLWVNVAVQRFQISHTGLKDCFRNGHRALQGRRLARRVRTGFIRGQVHRRVYYRVDQLEKLAALWYRPLPPKDGWIRRLDAKRIFKFSDYSLWEWSTSGCPLLGGRKLATHVEHGGVAGRARLYWRADLEEVSQQRKESRRKFKRDDNDTITSSQAYEELGLPIHVLRTWNNQKCPLLGGRVLRARRAVLVAADGHAREQWGYRYGDVKQIVANREKRARFEYYDERGMWLPQRAVYTRFGFARSDPSKWRRHGCPLLANKKLTAQRVEMDLPGNPFSKRVWVYLESDLRMIANARDGVPLDPPQDLIENGVELKPRKQGPGRPADPKAKLRLARCDRWDEARGWNIPFARFCAEERPPVSEETMKRDLKWRAMRRLRSRRKNGAG